MFNKINTFMTALMIKFADMKDGEEGQTSAEYVAVTAVAVAIALAVIYGTLSGALTTAVSDIGKKITDFVASPA